MDYQFYGWQAQARDKNGLTPRDLYDLFMSVFREDTCAPRMRKDWTPQNPTLGQCSVTAFLVQDLMGGRVYGVPLGDGNFHCFNAVDDCVFDLTSEQFGEQKMVYENCPEQFRAVHFAKEEKYLRYRLLRRRLMGEYAVKLKHSGYNCCQAVLCAYASNADMDVGLMKKLGAAFGVGMGCMEATCGALCAAETLLGLSKYQGAPILRTARDMHSAFTAACGASICKALKGAESGRVLCECDDCVRAAAAVIEDQLPDWAGCREEKR